MNILLIEDDEGKRKRLCQLLAAEYPDVVVSLAKSYLSGLRALIRGTPDLVLLDMTMPSFDITESDDGGKPQPFAGREVLRQLEARGISAKCVVVTQFQRFGEGKDSVTSGQLDAVLRQEHPGSYVGMVRFDATSSDWYDELKVYVSARRNEVG